METDSSYLLAQAIGGAILWIVYSIIVLFMVKIQRMKVGFIGVLVSCFFGIGATFVPFVGIYLSFPVVVFCLWRFAGTHAFGDAIFTVVISGALMFCFKLFVLASLMGNLSSTFTGLLPPDQVVDASELENEEPLRTENTAGTFDGNRIDKDAFVLKGINSGASRQLIMFQYADQMYTLEEGESCAVKTETATIRVRCVKVNRSHVELLLDDEKPFKLSLD